MTVNTTYTAIVPAAGVGKRMGAQRPKQYLLLNQHTLLEHTLHRLISHPAISHIVLPLHPEDPYFEQLSIANADWITRVDGGQERADSVLAGLQQVQQQDWVLVHDAARPCVQHSDIDKLLALAEQGHQGGILALRATDTMKVSASATSQLVKHTADRETLWHAQTPQFFPVQQLTRALSAALAQQVPITDEASAIEWAGGEVSLIEASSSNLKVTRPDDLALASFYLNQQREPI